MTTRPRPAVLTTMILNLVAVAAGLTGLIPFMAQLTVSLLCIAFILGIVNEQSAEIERRRRIAVTAAEDFLVWANSTAAHEDCPEGQRASLDHGMHMAHQMLEMMDNQAPWYVKLQRRRERKRVH